MCIYIYICYVVVRYLGMELLFTDNSPCTTHSRYLRYHLRFCENPQQLVRIHTFPKLACFSLGSTSTLYGLHDKCCRLMFSWKYLPWMAKRLQIIILPIPVDDSEVLATNMKPLGDFRINWGKISSINSMIGC